MSDGIRKCKTEQYALMGPKDVFYQHFGLLFVLIFTLTKHSDDNKDPCSLTQMGPVLYSGQLVFVWKKNFSYSRIFNH